MSNKKKIKIGSLYIDDAIECLDFSKLAIKLRKDLREYSNIEVDFCHEGGCRGHAEYERCYCPSDVFSISLSGYKVR